MNKLKITLFLFTVMLAVYAGGETSNRKGEGGSGEYKIVNVYPHDVNAFTQGLFYKDGFLYESTGLLGMSSLRKVELQTGRILMRIDLPKDCFGEGIMALDGRIYQLTWKERTGFIYDINDFHQLGKFQYKTEGWGLTSDGNNLIMSDGSPYLYFLNPIAMKIVRKLKVQDDSGGVIGLNELEFVKGLIYANIYMKDEIIKISPKTGKVTGRIDLSSMMKENRPKSKEGVLNGIAYDAKGDRLFVTGKMWPKLFEIRELTEKE